jgi:hypothetical protein
MEGSHVEGVACGFRPGRSQHDALNALAYGISLRQVNWVAACSPKSDDIKAARSPAGLLPASPRTRHGSAAVERLIGAGRDGRPWDPNPPGAGLISPG